MTFELPVDGCEYYKLKIADPVAGPNEWEASFDNGNTWTQAGVDGLYSSWLLCGPSFTPPVGAPVIIVAQDAP